MSSMLTRRRLLISAMATGLAACSRFRTPSPELNLWTLQLAPKFNRYFADVLAAWRERAEDVSGEAIDCGHFLAEELPDDTFARVRAFLGDGPW